MCASVETTNRASEYILKGGIETCAGAMMGAAVLGSRSLGAAFGISRFVVSRIASNICGEAFHVRDPQSSQTAKLVAGLAANILAAVAGFAVLSAIGVPLTSTIAVSVLSSWGLNFLMLSIVTNCLLGCGRDVVEPLPASNG